MRQDDDPQFDENDDGLADVGVAEADDTDEAPRGRQPGAGELPPVILGRLLRKVLHSEQLPNGSVPLEPADRRIAPLVFDCAGDVEAVPGRWVWPGRISLRGVAPLAGECRGAGAAISV